MASDDDEEDNSLVWTDETNAPTETNAVVVIERPMVQRERVEEPTDNATTSIASDREMVNGDARAIEHTLNQNQTPKIESDDEESSRRRRRPLRPSSPRLDANFANGCELESVARGLRIAAKVPSHRDDDADDIDDRDANLDSDVASEVADSISRPIALTGSFGGESAVTLDLCDRFARAAESYLACGSNPDASSLRRRNASLVIAIGKMCSRMKRSSNFRVSHRRETEPRDADAFARACETATRAVADATTVMKFARSSTLSDDSGPDCTTAVCVRPCDEMVCAAARMLMMMMRMVESSTATKENENARRAFDEMTKYVALRYSFECAYEIEPGVWSCEPRPNGEDELAETVAYAIRIVRGERMELPTRPNEYATRVRETRSPIRRTGHDDDVIRRAEARRLDVGRAEAFSGDTRASIDATNAGLCDPLCCAENCAVSLAIDYPAFATLCAHHDDMKDLLRLEFALMECLPTLSDGPVESEIGTRTAIALLASAIGDRLGWGTHGSACVDFPKDESDASILRCEPFGGTIPESLLENVSDFATSSQPKVEHKSEADAFGWTTDVIAVVRRAVKLLEACCCGYDRVDIERRRGKKEDGGTLEPILVATSALLRATEAVTDFSVRISRDVGRGLWSLGRESELCKTVGDALSVVAAALSNWATSSESDDVARTECGPESASDREDAEDDARPADRLTTVWKAHRDARSFALCEGEDGDQSDVALARCCKYWKTIRELLLDEGWYWPSRRTDSDGDARPLETLGWQRYACMCLGGSGRIVSSAASFFSGSLLSRQSASKGCGIDASDAVTFTVSLAAAAFSSAGAVLGRIVADRLAKSPEVRMFVAEENRCGDDSRSKRETSLALRACCVVASNACSACAIAASARATSMMPLFRCEFWRDSFPPSSATEARSFRLPALEREDDSAFCGRPYSWRLYASPGGWFSSDRLRGDDADERTIAKMVKRSEVDAERVAMTKTCEWGVGVSGDWRRCKSAIFALCRSAIKCVESFGRALSAPLKSRFEEVACGCLISLRPRCVTAEIGCLQPETTLNFLAAHAEEFPLGSRARSWCSAGQMTVFAILDANSRGEILGATRLAVAWMASECGWASTAIACGVPREHAVRMAELSSRLDYFRGYPDRHKAQFDVAKLASDAEREKKKRREVEPRTNAASSSSSYSDILASSSTSIWGFGRYVFSRFGRGGGGGESGASKSKPGDDDAKKTVDAEACAVVDIESGVRPVVVENSRTIKDVKMAVATAAIRAANISFDVSSDSAVVFVGGSRDFATSASSESTHPGFATRWTIQTEATVAMCGTIDVLARAIGAERKSGSARTRDILASVFDAAVACLARRGRETVGDSLVASTVLAMSMRALIDAEKNRREGGGSDREAGDDRRPTFDERATNLFEHAASEVAKLEDLEVRKIAFAAMRMLTLVVMREYRLPLNEDSAESDGTRAIGSMWFVPGRSLRSKDDARSPRTSDGRSDAEDSNASSKSRVRGWKLIYDSDIRECVGYEAEDDVYDDEEEEEKSLDAESEVRRTRRPIPFGYDFEVRAVVECLERTFVEKKLRHILRTTSGTSGLVAEISETWGLRNNVAHDAELYRACECLAYAARQVVDPVIATSICKIVRCAHEHFVDSDAAKTDLATKRAIVNITAWTFFAETAECQSLVIKLNPETFAAHAGRPLWLATNYAACISAACEADLLGESVPSSTWKLIAMGCCTMCRVVGVTVECIALAARRRIVSRSEQRDRDEFVGETTRSIVDSCRAIEKLFRIDRVSNVLDPQAAQTAAMYACSMAFPGDSTRGMIAISREIRDEIREHMWFSVLLTESLHALASAALSSDRKSEIKDKTAILAAVIKWTDRMKKHEDEARRLTEGRAPLPPPTSRDDDDDGSSAPAMASVVVAGGVDERLDDVENGKSQ